MHVLILALLFSYVQAADELKKTVHTLNKLNAVNLTSGINQCSNEGLLHKCAVDLCGRPNEAISGLLTDRTFAQYVKPDVMKRFDEIEGELTELIKSEVEANEKFIANLKSKLTEGKPDLKFDDWKTADYQKFTGAAFDDHLDTVINSKLELSKRVRITPIYPEEASEVFKKALDAYAKDNAKLLLTDKKAGISAGVYSKEEIKKIFDDAWISFNTKYLEKKKVDPEFMKDQNEILKNVKMASSQLDNLSSIVMALYYIDSLEQSYLLKTVGITPREIDIDRCQDKVCQLGVQEFLTNIKIDEKLVKLKKANSLTEVTKNHLIYCKSNLALKGMEDSDNESFLKIVPEIKKSILNKATKGFSEHSKAALEKYYEELHLAFRPHVKEDESLQAFIDEIHQRTKEEEEKEKEEKESDTKDLIKKLLGYEQIGMDIDPMAHSGFCVTPVDAVIWDAFAPKEEAYTDISDDIDFIKDNIIVSKFSCTHHNYGKSVIAHEMGHAMGFAFSENKLSAESFVTFKKIRACANNHHKKPSHFMSPYTTIEGDGLRTEEDTADIIAYMAYPETENLFGCALLSTTPDGQNYSSLAIENPIPQDPHSSPLLRILMEVIHKRKGMPESCQQVINESPSFGFEPCF